MRVVDEYSEVLIGMTCAVYGSRIIPQAALDAMEGERLQDILPQLITFGEDEIVAALRNGDHAAIDVSCGRGLLKFVNGISLYLPDGIAKICAYLYDMWFQYLSRANRPASTSADKDDPVNYGKEEFSRFVMDKITEMASKLSQEDRLAVRTLSSFVLYNQGMRIADDKRAHGLWALMDLLYRKTDETEHLSRILHTMLIREEIWKKNLFVG